MQVLHANNVGLLRLREALQLRALGAQEWREAQRTAHAITQVYTRVYPAASPVAALQAALEGKIAVLLARGSRRGGGAAGRGELEGALVRLRRGQDAVRCAFGGRHRVVEAVDRLVLEVSLTLSGHGTLA